MEMIEMANELNDPIRSFQNRLARLNDDAERLRPMVKSVQEAMTRSETRGSVLVEQFGPQKVGVRIMTIASEVKEAVLLLRELAKEGIHTDKEKTHEDINLLDVFATREYNLGPQCRLSVVVIGDKDGSKCRLEQVGTKEVPLYEMKCD